MKGNKTEQLFPNAALYEKTVELPHGALQALSKIDKTKLGKTELEQQQALKTIENWAQHLWYAMTAITREQQLDSKKQKSFQTLFEQKLIEFIQHPDHGITHAYYVYLGTRRLAALDLLKLTKSDDAQLQLLCLLHDSMQMLPFAHQQEKMGHLARSNQRNEHARIIAAITYKFGKQFGFDKRTIRALSFGLQKHDSSYANEYYPNGKLSQLSQLLHDADKLYGASYEADITSLVAGMLKRNFEANVGAKGSYLIRTALTRKYREKLTYGDRCYSDSIAVILRELGLKMYTNSGRKVAKERRVAAVAEMQKVYGEFFDETRDFIHTTLIPNLKNPQALEIRIIAMGKEPKHVAVPMSENKLQSIIERLYNKPLLLDKKYQRKNYKLTDARGWKLSVTEAKTGKVTFIDPSIARFCFKSNGREQFIKTLTRAFKSQLNHS